MPTIGTVAGVLISLDISQRSILGIGHAGHATFWSAEALLTKVKDRTHTCTTLYLAVVPLRLLRFRPFELFIYLLYVATDPGYVG
jgi:hypothetical protein